MGKKPTTTCNPRGRPRGNPSRRPLGPPPLPPFLAAVRSAAGQSSAGWAATGHLYPLEHRGQCGTTKSCRGVGLSWGLAARRASILAAACCGAGDAVRQLRLRCDSMTRWWMRGLQIGWSRAPPSSGRIHMDLALGCCRPAQGGGLCRWPRRIVGSGAWRSTSAVFLDPPSWWVESHGTCISAGLGSSRCRIRNSRRFGGIGWGPKETLAGWSGPASAVSVDAATLPGGEAEVPPIHIRIPPRRKSKIQSELGGGGALRVVTSTEAPSWEAQMVGREMLWVVGAAWPQQQ